MNTKSMMATVFLMACPLIGHAQTPPVPVPAPTASPVTLRYKFTLGQAHRYKYEMDMNGTILTGQSGAGIPLNTTMQMVVRQTVKEIRPTDGAATISAQIEDLHMLQNGQEVALPAAQAAQMKKPYIIVMLPTGKTLSAEMPSRDVEMPSQDGTSLYSFQGMDFSKNMFSSTAFLPDGPVKVGDTWTGSGASAMAGVQTTFTFVLNSLAQKEGATLATIGQKQSGTIHMTMSKGMPVPIKMSGKVTGDGTQVFDTDAGAIQSATGTSGTTMTMHFGKAADGTTPPGMPTTMQMQMQTKLTMERLSDSAPTTPPVQ